MTPPLKVKRSKAQKDQLNLVRNGQPHVAPALKSVSKPDSELHAVQLACASTTEKLVKTQDQLLVVKEKNADLYGTLRVERRKCQRTAATKKKLEEQIKLLQSVELPNAKGDATRAIQLLEQTRSNNENLKHELSRLLERCTLEASKTKATQAEFKIKLARSKKESQNLQKRCNRMPEIKAKAVEKARICANKENRTHKLLHKGSYSPQARDLARTLVAAGCSREYVGNVIHAVCKSAGVAVQGNMSRRTVSRAILEGGIAAQIQIGHELAQAQGK
jgi:hypothetical protein